MRKLMILTLLVACGCTKYATRDDANDEVYPPEKSDIRQLEDRLGV